ncbi:hypothetical protein [Ochrobactrum sp. A-1]|uniref:hypothetical protein n=1 Tax=Ochrobactrum sp. A-1 TaxID=2920940 RepID=UPI001F0B3CE9|nr:hypothetical protein [Ochrobactrum sp. A-1]
MDWLDWTMWGVASATVLTVFANCYSRRSAKAAEKSLERDNPVVEFPRGTDLKRGKDPIHVIYRLSPSSREKWEVTEAKVIRPKNSKLISLTGEGISDGMGNYTSYHPVEWSNNIDFRHSSSDGFLISNETLTSLDVQFKVSLKANHKSHTFFVTRYNIIDTDINDNDEINIKR